MSEPIFICTNKHSDTFVSDNIHILIFHAYIGVSLLPPSALLLISTNAQSFRSILHSSK